VVVWKSPPRSEESTWNKRSFALVTWHEPTPEIENFRRKFLRGLASATRVVLVPKFVSGWSARTVASSVGLKTNVVEQAVALTGANNETTDSINRQATSRADGFRGRRYW